VGENQEDAFNTLRDEELRKSLVTQSIEYFRATGDSKDMKHSEPGYGCVIDLDTATELGRTWPQNAVFWAGRYELIRSIEEKSHPSSGGTFLLGINALETEFRSEAVRDLTSN